jgi:hexokinase
MEWGGFNSHDVPGCATVFDYSIDREEDPTSQRFEKQISGRYLGEIARKVCVHLMDSGLLFSDSTDSNLIEAANQVFRHKHTFTTPMMSAIEGSDYEYVLSLKNSGKTTKFSEYFLNASYENQQKIRTGWVSKSAMDAVINLNAADSPESFANQSKMAQDFVRMWMTASERDREIITNVCHMVSTRAARLAAAAIVAVVRKTKRKKCTVAVDGSVFEKYPHFQADMENAITEMCGDDYELKLVHAEDGSGKGAALIASVL